MSDEEFKIKYLKYKQKYINLKYNIKGGTLYSNNVKISELKNKNIYDIIFKSNNKKLKNIKIFIKKSIDKLQIYYYNKKKKINLQISDCIFYNPIEKNEQRQLNLPIPLIDPPQIKPIFNPQQRLIKI